MAVIRIKARRSDGTIEKNDASYSVARALSYGGVVSTEAQTLRLKDRRPSGLTYEESIALLNFNTSVLGAGAIINSARLALQITNIRAEPAYLTARQYHWTPPLLPSHGIDGANLSSLTPWATAGVFTIGEIIFDGEIPVNLESDTGMLLHYDTLANGTPPVNGLRSVTFGSGDSLLPPEIIVDFTAPAPVVTDFSPKRGIAGQLITITGQNFGGTSSVTVGGTPVTLFEVVSSTQINAVVGESATGVVEVTTPFNSAQSVDQFVFLLPPTITGASLMSGKAGDALQVFGTFLDGATLVTTAGVIATIVSIATDGTSIDILLGSGDTAVGPIVVETQRGQSSFAGFTYLASPTVASFSPSSQGAGFSVSLVGNNFVAGQTAVRFIGSLSPSVNVTSKTTLTAVVPSGISGTGNIEVITNAPPSATIGGFTFIPAPIVTGIPASGYRQDPVTIFGQNFTNASVVKFINVNALSFIVVSSTQINAIVPNGIANGAMGTISVTTPGGTHELGTFTHSQGAATITSFNPPSGGDGTIVTVKGTNFLSATNVLFGNIPTNFTIVDNKTIVALVQGGSTGFITVSTPFTPVPASSATQFTYTMLSNQPVLFRGATAVNSVDVSPRSAFQTMAVKVDGVFAIDSTDAHAVFLPLPVRLG